MIDVETRLADLLTRTADAVEVRPDLDAVVAGERRSMTGPPAVDLEGRRRPPRRAVVAAAAAAAVVALVAGGLALRAADRDEGVDTLDRPSEPAPLPSDRYPALGWLPPEVEGTAFAHLQPPLSDAHTEAGVEVGPASQVVIGRPTTDGTVSDLVLVTAGLDGPPTEEIEHRTEVIAGRTATVLRDDPDQQPDGFPPLTTVVFEGRPTITATGRHDVVALLDQMGADGLVATVDEDAGEGPPTVELAVTGLPPGYEVLATHRSDDGGPIAQVSLDGGVDGRSVVVEASETDPLALLALTGAVERVDVAGREGWAVLGTEEGAVAWTEANGVTLSLHTQQLGPEATLAIARDVRLVDRATWDEVHRASAPEPGLPVRAGTTAPR